MDAWERLKRLFTKLKILNSLFIILTEEYNIAVMCTQFYLDQTFDNVAHAKRTAKNAINLYNEIRLHLSLDYKTPNMVYKLSA